MENARNTAWESEVRKKAYVETFIKLDDNDIFTWLATCTNPETLKYLGRAALTFAHHLENKEEPGWHSDIMR